MNIYVFISCVIILIYINILKILPNKSNKVLIGMACIDRDSDICHIVYEKLLLNIQKYPNIKFDILIVTRHSDKKIIKYYKNKAIIIKVENYIITDRHNMNMISKKYNIIRKYTLDNNYDTLFTLESDIIMNDDTFDKHFVGLNISHVTTSYYDIPWAGYPVICYEKYFFPIIDNAKNHVNKYIIGHGLGACMIRANILNDINFDIDTWNGIIGQDIGFFKQCYMKKYKVYLVNDYVNHLYDKNKISCITS